MAKKRRVRKWLERATLGAVMSVVAFVIERRLLKIIRLRGAKPVEGEKGVELAAPAKQVKDQAQR